MKEQDDILCVKQVLAGNTSAFAVLVDRHKDMVFSVALKIIRNSEEAEEIAQDAFIKAYQSLSSFKGEAKFSTWLYRIVYNAAISHTRQRRQEFTSIDENLSDKLSTDEMMGNIGNIEPQLQSTLIEKAISRLHPTESALVMMFYYNDKSINDISLITGLTTANVKVKLHRIRMKLLKEMNDLMKIEALS